MEFAFGRVTAQIRESYDQHHKTAESSVTHPLQRLTTACASSRLALRRILTLVLAAVVFAIDQGTKYLVVTQYGWERITVIDGLLWWYSIRNSGAAFEYGREHSPGFSRSSWLPPQPWCCTCCATPAPCPGPSLGGLLGGICGNLLTVSSVRPGFRFESRG